MTPLRLLLFVLAACIAMLLWHGWEQFSALRKMQEAPLGQFIGPADAPITVTEFIDYRCHLCRQMHPVVVELVTKHPDVRVVFRHLPMAMEPAVYEAQIALAAAQQGMFVPVHGWLMSRETPVTTQDLDEAAEKFKLDRARLDADMKGDKVRKELKSTVDSAIALGGITLPSFIINNRLYLYDTRVPTLAELERAVAAARDGLARKPSPAPADAAEPAQARP